MKWSWINQNFEWMFLTLATYRFAYRPDELFLVKLSIVVSSVFALKYTIGRERPNKKDTLSFPSGHSALAWFLAWEYNHPIIYLWACSVSYARVKEYYHWWSDVIFSIGLTYYINFFFER